MTGIYTLVHRTHQSQLNMEPALMLGAYAPKTAKQVASLPHEWQDYTRAVNGRNDGVWQKIIDPRWGPSTGLQNGKLGLISAGYWTNVVYVLETFQNGAWGRVECFGVQDAPPDPYEVNASTAPEKIHHVTMQNRDNQLVETGQYNADHAYIPLIAAQANELYFPMAWLAKLATIRVITGHLNVRVSPSTGAAVVAELANGAQVMPLQIVVGEGGVWARIDTGWIALRYNGKLMTDWAV